MSSKKTTPMSTPVRRKITYNATGSRFANENVKPSGTPLSHVKALKESSVSSPKTPLSTQNRFAKSPQRVTAQSRPTTPKNVSSSQTVRPSILKNKTGEPSTPKHSSGSAKPTTPKKKDTFKSPSKCVTPVRVENNVLVQFSQDIFSSGKRKDVPSTPRELKEPSPDPYGMFDKLNRSHSASSLFRLKKKDDETPKAALKRSLSEAKLSLNSSMETEGEKSRLTVGVRVRPLLPREGMNSIHVEDGEIKVASDLGSEISFKYDHCFSTMSSQKEVYAALVRPLLDNAFQGYNACLFAYGQTGSGKTYSMMGPYSEDIEDSDGKITTESGMIPRFCEELLQRKAALEEENPSVTLSVKVSYLEVYNEKIHDLLVPGNSQLRVREHPVYGPYVVDLSQHSVNTFEEIQHWMSVGNKKRAVASTEHNDKSSRSHSLFTVRLTQSFAQVRSDGSWSHDQTRRSQINLVDLAGSERIANSAVSTDRLREGVSINRSLLTLGKVMSALVDRRGFVPYRDSVLTWLLKESLGGNSRTCMLATVSPCSNHMDETLSTLRYASQARSIVNRVRVNEAPQDREIRQLREEVDRLRGAGERIDTLLSENEGLRQQLKKSDEDRTHMKAEIMKYRNDLATAEDTKLQLLKELSEASMSSESVVVPSEQISKYESEIKMYKEKTDELNKQNLGLKEKLDSLIEKDIKQKSSQLVLESDAIKSLKEEVIQLQAELKKSKLETKEALSNNEVLQECIVQKNVEAADLNAKIQDNDKIISNFKKDLQSLKENYKQAENSLAETKESNRKLQKKIEELTVREEHLKHELEQIPALERALSDFEVELRLCKDELIEMKRNKEDWLKSKKDLESKLEETEKKLSESTDREALLNIKLERIPNLESELRLAEAEARKAQRELDEYLAQNNSDDSIGKNELNDTLFQNNVDLNDTPVLPMRRVANQTLCTALENEDGNDSHNSSSASTDSKEDEIYELKTDLDLCKSHLGESEKINGMIIKELKEVKAEKERLEEDLKKCKQELFESHEKIIAIKDSLEEDHKAALSKLEFLNNDLKRVNQALNEERKLNKILEDKLAESEFTIKKLKFKSDNAVQLEIQLDKCKEELHQIKSAHVKELSESKSREEVAKAELALKNQLVEDLKLQLTQSQEIQKSITQENLGLIKAMKKKCNDGDSSKSTALLEKNISLKKDMATLKEKLAEKDKQINDSQRLLREVIRHEIHHEKAIAGARLEWENEVYDYTMDNAYPHHLNYLVRKARKFTETYKIPYEFELKEKTVLIKHLLLSAKATLTHFQLSKWIEKIEAEKIWTQRMDKDLPWEVDFRDYYDKNVILKPSEEDATEADSAFNCGVQVTAAGCINPILWRKTMVRRHVLGIKEDSEVLIKYFNEIEDSRIYSILTRIQVAVARLHEATENVEK